MSQHSKINLAGESPMLPQFSVGMSQQLTPNTDSHGNTSTTNLPQPKPSPAPIPWPPTGQTPYPRNPYPGEHHEVPRHRFLSNAEWAVIAHGVGGIRDREHQSPIHPSSWWWPPKGMPRGLYKDTVIQRAKFFYLYHAASSIRWILMILQLLIGATLTALGSMSLHDGAPITVLGAANTVIAGLLAFLQNSGLPDRYRYDMAEFELLEDHIKELLDSGIAPADQATDQILAECFDLYQDAKATVSSNLPANYTSRLGQQASQKSRNLQAGSQPAVAMSSALPFDSGNDKAHVEARK